ncbi:hypothetical protein BV22DRAFT_1051202 [Leucogyrophana mollusca]|uniref:Uncharacterized protein n=1 Tax=Leucogyrophana mollusca TaxID=85980 RepID=A0ACB8B2W9_9AGAM|nr:hypothetical protein BV22DRAFT_1051202 [Leucogyrophana mollusca]
MNFTVGELLSAVAGHSSEARKPPMQVGSKSRPRTKGAYLPDHRAMLTGPRIAAAPRSFLRVILRSGIHRGAVGQATAILEQAALDPYPIVANAISNDNAKTTWRTENLARVARREVGKAAVCLDCIKRALGRVRLCGRQDKRERCAAPPRFQLAEADGCYLCSLKLYKGKWLLVSVPSLSLLASPRPPWQGAVPVQCTAATAKSSQVSEVARSVGLILGDASNQVGLDCVPITGVGVGSGVTCTPEPLCCTTDEYVIILPVAQDVYPTEWPDQHRLLADQRELKEDLTTTVGVEIWDIESRESGLLGLMESWETVGVSRHAGIDGTATHVTESPRPAIVAWRASTSGSSVSDLACFTFWWAPLRTPSNAAMEDHYMFKPVV